MNLSDLKKELPYKWRVQSANQWGANCVAYIDARDVQDILDDVCGQENWQVKYEEHKGNLFALIGILVNNIWAWKSDCGTESAVEKQKGEASDAFKRAAVMWGVGRFLYSKKIVKLPVKQNEQQKWIPFVDGKFITLASEITRLCEQKQNENKPTAPPIKKEPITPKEVPTLTTENYNIAIASELKFVEGTLKAIKGGRLLATTEQILNLENKIIELTEKFHSHG